MSFHFVHTTPDNLEHDEETRKQIRRQAMRSYRRRLQVLEESDVKEDDDEEDDGNCDRGREEGSNTASPSDSSANRSRQASRQRSVLSVPRSSGQRRHPSREEDSLPLTEEGGSWRPTKRRGSSQSDTAQHDEEGVESSRKARRGRKLPLEAPTHAQHGKFGSFVVALPEPRTTKRSQQSSTVDVEPLFTSAAQVEQILNICRSHRRWLVAQFSGEVVGGMTARLENPGDDPAAQMALFAQCLQAIGHLHAINFEGAGRVDEKMLKTRVLALANRRLRDPVTALEDETIRALACLTDYEGSGAKDENRECLISRGSTEARLHLTGLSQIIDLRGGLDKIGQKGGGGLQVFVEILDLLHAVYFHTVPIFTTAAASSSEDQGTPKVTRVNRNPTAGVDAQTLEDLSDSILSIPELNEETIFDQTGNFVAQNAGEESSSITSRVLQQEIDKWHQRLVGLSQTMTSDHDEGKALASICKLAAALHLTATSAVRPHPVRLQTRSAELFEAMNTLRDEAWDGLEGMHVRILLTALSISQVRAHKSAYTAYLSRRLSRVEKEGWNRAKALILDFICMHAAVERRRRPENETVTAVVNGIEIVVDPTEAMERGMRVRRPQGREL